MPELDRLLDGFDAEPGPAPVGAEIRRRGDRLRRRNRALAFAGAAVAVAAIATPLALFGGGDDLSGPAPAERPPEVRPPLLSVPPDFPLTSGLADGAAVIDRPEVAVVEPCRDSDIWSLVEPAPVDWVATAPSDRTASRTLVVYANSEDAAASLAALRSAYAGCTADRSGRTLVTEESPFGGSDDSVVISATNPDGAEPTTPPVVTQVVQTGNALLLATYDAADATAPTQDLLDDAAETTLPVVEAMADFRAGTVEPDRDAVVDDTHLLAPEDLPEAQGLSPWTSVDDDGGPTLICQSGTLDDLAPTTVLTRRFTAADENSRDDVPAEVRTAVLEFPDDTATEEALDVVTAWLDECDLQATTLGDPATESTPSSDSLPPDVPEGSSVDIAAGGQGYGIHVDPAGPTEANLTVAALGDRMVLVSYARAGRPTGEDAVADPLLRAASDRMIGLDG